MIKNTLPDKSGNPESLEKESKKFKNFSTNVSIVVENLLRAFYRLFYLQYFDSGDQWKKQCVAKLLLAIWEIFLYEDNRNYISFIFNYKFAFIFLLSLKNEKRESGFQQVGGLVTRNISIFLFIASQALLQSHAEFNRLL